MEIRNNTLIKVEQFDVIDGILTIPDNVNYLTPFCFKDIDVSKIILGRYVRDICENCFSESNASSVELNNYVGNIGRNAFFNCEKLMNINLDNGIISIGRHAFYGCKSLESIYIGDTFCEIEDGAFANSGIKSFYISKNNKNFFTDESKKLLIDKFFNIISYAVGSLDSSFNMMDYVETIDCGVHATRPIYSIHDEAFKGASHLKELILSASITGIGYNAFESCPNLEILDIRGSSFFTMTSMELLENGHYFISDFKDPYIPFTKLRFSGKLTDVKGTMFLKPYKLKDVEISDDVEGFKLDGYQFYNFLKNVESLYIPEGVSRINNEVLPNNILIKLHNGFEHVGPLSLETHKLDNYIYQTVIINNNDKKYCRVYKYKNKINENNLISVTILNEDDLRNELTNVEYVLYNKDSDSSLLHRYTYVKDLIISKNLDMPVFNNGLFMTAGLDEINELVDYLSNDNEFAIKVLDDSKILSGTDKYYDYLFMGSTKFNGSSNISRIINYIELLKKYNITNKIFYDKRFIAKADLDELEYLFSNHLDIFTMILKSLKISNNNFEIVYNDNFDSIYDLVLEEKCFSTFIDKLNRYGIKDRFLYDINLIKISTNPLFDEILKYYDGNMKRLLLFSNTLNINGISSYDNTYDLLTLMKITGCFNKDKVKRQQSQTFIIEKVFEGHYESDIPSSKITGNEIHSVFNFTPLEEELEEFEIFFRENYLQLTKLEVIKSGYIRRIYENFKNISKTSSSNKGEQRHLKVTIEKCINYLKNNKFENVPYEYRDLALLIGEYFDYQNFFDFALKYVKESEDAPRNIFIAPTLIDDEIIYNNDPNHDLRNMVNEFFSYEWLPKQDYNNLILGKYCNCCAHIGGAGAGIMRASMTSDSHQNLVIRNSLGEIVAKSTIYVNKNEGYAVFNTVEASFKIREKGYERFLYEAFMQACIDFINTYNNNFEIPITTISIGTNRNYLINELTDEKHPIITPLSTIPYSNFRDEFAGYYDGDSRTQRLILKI